MLLYLSLLGGGALLAERLFRLGAPLILVVLGATLAASGALWLLERLRPHCRDWLASHGDLRTDTIYYLLANAVAVLANRADAAASLRLPVWPANWPFALQLPLALLLGELAIYWIHRAQHRIRFLWRFHRIHHSAPRVYWLNQARIHPVETLLNGLSIAPLSLLGVPERVLAVYLPLLAIHSLVVHSNIRLDLGPLNGLLNHPAAHRWHHSRKPEESDSNYGTLLLLWDRIFGTCSSTAPEGEPAETGLPARPEVPPGFLAQLAQPFRPEGR